MKHPLQSRYLKQHENCITCFSNSYVYHANLSQVVFKDFILDFDQPLRNGDQFVVANDQLIDPTAVRPMKVEFILVMARDLGHTAREPWVRAIQANVSLNVPSGMLVITISLPRHLFNQYTMMLT